MAGTVIATNQRTASLPLPSKNLASSLMDKTEPFYGPNGYDERLGPWKPPAVISRELRAEAALMLDQSEALLRPAAQSSLRSWLVSLGALVANSGSDSNASARVDAYSGLVDASAGALTKTSLKRAAAQFKFWPSYSELAEFLAGERSGLIERARRMRAIVDASETSSAPRLEHHENRSRDGASQERGLRAIGEIRQNLRSLVGAT